MSMPTRDDYVVAIQDPTNIALPLLHSMRLACIDNTPRVWTGAFGIVFRFERSDGTARAVKCFTSTHRTRAERYEAISEHLDRVFFQNHPLTRYLANTLYMRQGIRVQGKWRPLLLMDWVDGVFIDEYVGALVESEDAGRRVAETADQWIEMVFALRGAQVAHGDLQHGNVLITPSGDMKLIDYDGLCVPTLANRYVMEGGHQNYQHPARTLRFDENLDAFSALVILTALTAVSLQPGLWRHYYKGNNMLFVESDFQAPDTSPLFHDLERIGDSRLLYLTRELRKACATRDASAVKAFEEIVAALSGQ